jgi:hypothetical protein
MSVITSLVLNVIVNKSEFLASQLRILKYFADAGLGPIHLNKHQPAILVAANLRECACRSMILGARYGA